MLRELVISCTDGDSWRGNEWISVVNGWMYVNQTSAVHGEIARLLGHAEGIK